MPLEVIEIPGKIHGKRNRASLRFDEALNVDLNDFQTNLAPFGGAGDLKSPTNFEGRSNATVAEPYNSILTTHTTLEHSLAIQIFAAKDHVSIQMNICDVDKTTRVSSSYFT